MSKKILLCGSIAFDFVMTYDGVFNDVIKASNLSALSASFMANTCEKNFGGCAGNIAYNLSLLEKNPLVYSVIGNDFDGYLGWMKKHSVDCDYLPASASHLTASAYILSDKSGNQITIFSPGAMSNQEMAMNLDGLPLNDIKLAIISPDNPLRLLSMVKQCQENSIPYVFDPGQIVHALQKDDLLECIKQSHGLITNEFEADILMEKLGMSKDEISLLTPFFIVTMGENGCELIIQKESQKFDAVKAETVADPTGCGDAFRAGLLAALFDDKSLEEAIQYGLLMGSIAVTETGTQNHKFSLDDFKRYYQVAFPAS